MVPFIAAFTELPIMKKKQWQIPFRYCTGTGMMYYVVKMVGSILELSPLWLLCSNRGTVGCQGDAIKFSEIKLSTWHLPTQNINYPSVLPL